VGIDHVDHINFLVKVDLTWFQVVVVVMIVVVIVAIEQG
jgi:hypothetical protein